MTHDEAVATFCAVFKASGLDDAVDAVACTPALVASDTCFTTIVNVVCASYGIAQDQLFSKSRVHADARHVVMWLVGETRVSLPKNGKVLRGMHHTSCLHGIRRVQKTEHLLARAGQLLATCKRVLGNRVEENRA